MEEENNDDIQQMQLVEEENESSEENENSEQNRYEEEDREQRQIDLAMRRIFGHGGIFSRRIPAAEENHNDDNETLPENIEGFDTDLPAEHSYLGNLIRVSGVDYLEPGKSHRICLHHHHSIIFPGETLPMIVPNYMLDSGLVPTEGLLFGVVFPSMWKFTKPNLYGVTCQVYEKGNDDGGFVSILSRTHQRFVISKKQNPNITDFLRNTERNMYANVVILPEVVLPDPLSCINLGSMNRFKDIDSMARKLKNMQASTTIWPAYVYEQYDMKSTIEKAKQRLCSLKINSMPTDFVLLSFWLGQNLLFDAQERLKIFLTNSVNARMKFIEKSLDKDKFFCCTRCANVIANCKSAFAMSKEGVQSHYCNPSGFIHETNTVLKLRKDAVYATGSHSIEFSWFPGYSWQIIQCRLCDSHIGWKFVATKSTLVPRRFYGLSGSSVIVNLVQNIPSSIQSVIDMQRQA